MGTVGLHERTSGRQPSSVAPGAGFDVQDSLVTSGFAGTPVSGVAQNRTHSTHRPLLAAVLATAMIAGGCSSSSGTSSSSKHMAKSGPAVTNPTTSTTSPETSIASAVRAFWDLYLELGARSGPFDQSATRTRLAERTSGDELQQLLIFFAANSTSGLVVRGEIDIAPHVVSIDGNDAQVRDCYDDRTGFYRVADGTRIDTDDPLRHQILMTFVREGGVWKVSAIRDEGKGCVV